MTGDRPGEPTPSYDDRLAVLREAKVRSNLEKQDVTGSLNGDDLANVLPPEDRRLVVQAVSGSGVPITDVILTGVEMKPNHENGGFYGPKACGENFALLLKSHPGFVDPNSSLAGAYMTSFGSYRTGGWKPELDFSHLADEQRRYGIVSGIGASQHFCQDLAIGLKLGWSGIREKIISCRKTNQPGAQGFYDGLLAIVEGMQDWISRNAALARETAVTERNPLLRSNLLEIASINDRLVSQPPVTFREACQWIVWYQMAARMYNGSGSLGKLDLLLERFYERGTQDGTLSDEEAVFHLACLLLRDTAYIQLGGPDGSREDVTNPVSFLALEAARRLRVPCNLAVCYGRKVDPRLLCRGVEILFETRLGIPKFLGIDNFVEGFRRNGYTRETATRRAYSGCHWCALPGREYTLNDCVKINLAAVFLAALNDMVSAETADACVDELWNRFRRELGAAVKVTAAGLDFQVEHMHEVYPELMLDLLCHGPIEQGIDASHGGVEHVNLCIDGSALATVADSFAAIEQRVEVEQRMTWCELSQYLADDWSEAAGERARVMMRSVPRFGSGGSRADEWAQRVAQTFTRLVKQSPTPNGHNMIPGLFSWANTIGMGKETAATPNGRRAGEPISHGANPDPGFRIDGALTAMASAIAAVQPGWGNSAPMQLEIDPGTMTSTNGIEHITSVISTHFDLGGTQVNVNVIDKERLVAAHDDPTLYPELIVRVTGFSAYFCRLTPEFRQLVIDRVVAGG